MLHRPIDLVWFKRDLRVHDHAPLFCSFHGSRPTVGLYIVEPSVWDRADASPTQYEVCREGVEELREALSALGVPLVVRVGEAVGVLDALHHELAFARILSHVEVGNATTYARDLAVAKWARGREVSWHEVRQSGVERRSPGRDGWAERWRVFMDAPVVPTPRGVQRWRIPARVARGAVPAWEALAFGAFAAPERMKGGESRALELLEGFLEHRGATYQYDMSSPTRAFDACSRLSHHLAVGSISQRLAYQRARERADELRAIGGAGGFVKSLGAFESRLAWRCHFMQRLEDEPEVEWRNLNRAFDGLREEDPDAWDDATRARFEAWSHGRTGLPMVDACMRALRAGGWINFRMRAMLMSTASYLLWLDWRPTSRVLGSLFVDMEAGIHYSQAQMQSGVTGINTVRVYSPRKQVSDQDPTGAFIRRYVPELAGVPDAHLPQPHLMPADVQRACGCVIGRDYPEPVVDEVQSRKDALDRVYAVRKTAFAERESARVLRAHGSRSKKRWGRPKSSRSRR